MATTFGHAHFFGIGEESTFGTGVAPASGNYYEATSDELQRNQVNDPKPGLLGRTHNRRVAQMVDVSGAIAFDLGYEGYEKIFKHALGAGNTTGVGPYVHAFTLADDLPTGLSITSNKDSSNLGGTSCERFLGCRINKLTLTQSRGEHLKASMEILGRNSELISTPTASYPTFDGILYDELTAQIASSTIEADEIEVTIENNLKDDHYKLGSQLRAAIPPADKRVITVKIVKDFDSLTEWNYYRNLTNVLVELDWTNGSDILDINLPVVNFNAGAPTVSDPGVIPHELVGQAFLSSAQNDELTINLTNNTSAI